VIDWSGLKECLRNEEVAAAAMYLKDTLGKEGIQELISNLSKDRGRLVILFFVYACIILNVSACFNIHLFLLIRGLMHLFF
jgi:hypothetical protein